MKTFAEKIKELRTKQNLTQEEFAKRLHVSREAVSKWEQGRGIPDIENLRLISLEFNISIDHLLDIETVAMANQNAIVKMKRIQLISSIVIAVCLIFFIVIGFINFPIREKTPSRDLSMPEGVLIGFYIDISDNGNIKINDIIENNHSSDDVYFIVSPIDNNYIQQGIHNFNDIKIHDYNNYQCDIFILNDAIESSKYYQVFYNYRFLDYQKAHGYSLVEIEDAPLFTDTTPMFSSFRSMYTLKYVIYGAEMFASSVINSSFYFNVCAVENFKKMKFSEFDKDFNELLTTDINNQSILTLNPLTYQGILYYSTNGTQWYQSNDGRFMFGSMNESYQTVVKTQLVNDYDFVSGNDFFTIEKVKI